MTPAESLAKMMSARSAEISDLVASEGLPAILILDPSDDYAAAMLPQMVARGGDPGRTIYAADHETLVRVAPPSLRAETRKAIEIQRTRLRPGEIIVAGMTRGTFALAIGRYTRTGETPSPIGEG